MPGSVEITNHLDDVFKGLTGSTRAAVEAGANAWRSALLQTLKGSRSGRIYRVPGTQRTYQASAPGEAPASVTGDLRTSYEVVVVSDSEAQLGSILDKALWLEEGTTRMAARPHLGVSFHNNQKQITDQMIAAFTRGFR